MTSQTHAPPFIPKQLVVMPDFKRGSMGKDVLSPTSAAPFVGEIIDKQKRDSIASFSKGAHFQFTAHCKDLDLNKNLFTVTLPLFSVANKINK